MHAVLYNLLALLQPEATSAVPSSAPSGGGAPKGGGGFGDGGYTQLAIMVGMMALLYFVMIRPQQKKQKEHDQLISGLKKGQKVRTSGGIRGEIVDFKDNEVALLIADRVKIQILRSHIAGLVESEETPSASK